MTKNKFEFEISTQSSMDRAVKGICDKLRRDKAKGAKAYVPELSWMLFLCYLDLLEFEKEKKFVAVGKKYINIIPEPYRWRDWALEYDKKISKSEIIKKKLPGWKRCDLDNKGIGKFLDFVNKDLFNFLSKIGSSKSALDIQKVISIMFKIKEKTVLKVEANLQDAIDEITKLSSKNINEKHLFPISQAYEGLLPDLGAKNSDGGQFFTPREIIKVIIETIKPKIGKTIFDPCCGTGGFFIEAFKYLSNKKIKPSEIEFLKSKTFWGKEQEDDAILMLLANLVLHNIDSPKIWHGNTLTGTIDNNELFHNAPQTYDYIFTNPPFGSKEGKAAQAKFPYKCSKAQILFIQEIIDNLKDGGECGMVIDEGVMFHSKTKAFLQTKKKLLNENNLHTIISLPPGVFVNANAASKTNLLFFKKGSPTKKIWYYDMAITEEFIPRKVNKGNPLLFEHFNDFFKKYNLSPNDPKKISERSWFVNIDEIKKTNYKIHAQNNNKPDLSDKRTSKQIYESISKNLRELNDIVKNLK